MLTAMVAYGLEVLVEAATYAGLLVTLAIVLLGNIVIYRCHGTVLQVFACFATAITVGSATYLTVLLGGLAHPAVAFMLLASP